METRGVCSTVNDKNRKEIHHYRKGMYGNRICFTKMEHCLYELEKFGVVADHSASKWLSNLRDPRGRLASRVVDIQDYSFEIMHAPGPQLVVADTLSRDAVAGDSCPYCDKNVQAVLPVLALPTTSKIKVEQQKQGLQDDQDLQKREDILEVSVRGTGRNGSISTIM